jgi:hypothetical protein
VTMVAHLRWDAARSHRPGPRPPGQRGPNPWKGKRQRRLQEWAERPDTPWEMVEVDWSGGQRRSRWGFSHTALWHTPGLPPVELRCVSGCNPAGGRRRDACCWTDLPATPVHSLAWVVRRGSVEVTCAEGRAQLGREPQRQWSDQAMARTTPVRLALFALVTVLALRLSQDGQIPVPVTAGYHKAEPTFSDCVALVRRHLWRARYMVHSPPGAESRPLPQEALDLLLHGLPRAASLAKAEE